METGERIKALRIKRRMTADALAEKVGVSRATMFRYEDGQIEKMPIQRLVPIAWALNTTVGYLMGWEDNAPTAESGECEREVMACFESLSEAGQMEALNYLRYLADKESKT